MGHPRLELWLEAYSSPSSFASFARSNPTTGSSLIKVTGVVIKPRFCNSSSAASSLLTSRSSNSIPFLRKKLFRPVAKHSAGLAEDGYLSSHVVFLSGTWECLPDTVLDDPESPASVQC